MKDSPQTVAGLKGDPAKPPRWSTRSDGALSNIANAALATKALNRKTKELIALRPCQSQYDIDDCIAFHRESSL